MISKIQVLTTHCISLLKMPPSFSLVLCTFRRWKQCLLVTKTWQIRGRVEEKPFIKKLELTTVFFCSVARRWVCSLLMALCTFWSARLLFLYSVCIWELWDLCYMQQFTADRHVDLLATCVTLLLSSPCQSACLFVSDVYPPPHVDNQYNTVSFNHLVGWLWKLC